MRIATWNVNSLRVRLPQVLDLLLTDHIDVIALQETKIADDDFPDNDFHDAGYEVVYTGTGGYSGVALASRVGLTPLGTCFHGQPGFSKDPATPQVVECRAVGGRVGEAKSSIDVWSLYVPQGRGLTDRHYAYKLNFLYALGDYAACQLTHCPDHKALYLGDFNVAPEDSDVWDTSAFLSIPSISEPERAALAYLKHSGLSEVTRQLPRHSYTFWQYNGGAIHRNEGMRIDFHFATPALASTAVRAWVDVEKRHCASPSDHAPVIVDYALDSTAPATLF